MSLFGNECALNGGVVTNLKMWDLSALCSSQIDSWMHTFESNGNAKGQDGGLLFMWGHAWMGDIAYQRHYIYS